MSSEKRLELDDQVDVLGVEAHIDRVARGLTHAAHVCVSVSAHGIVKPSIALVHSALSIIDALHALLLHLTLASGTIVGVGVIALFLASFNLLLCVNLVIVVAAARIALESHVD